MSNELIKVKADNAKLIREIDDKIHEWESAAAKSTERCVKIAHLHVAHDLRIEKGISELEQEIEIDREA